MPRNTAHAERDHNILLRFSVFMLVVVALSSAVLGLILADYVRGHIIRMHGTFYAESLSLSFEKMLISGDVEEIATIKGSIANESTLPHIKGLALWNISGKPVYGDDASFAFQNSASLELVRSGKVVVVYEKNVGPAPHDSERGDFVFFLPAKDTAGRIIGIIGLRESDKALAEDIDDAARRITFYIAVAGVVIYGFLFLLYYQSYQRQKIATERQVRPNTRRQVTGRTGFPFVHRRRIHTRTRRYRSPA